MSLQTMRLLGVLCLMCLTSVAHAGSRQIDDKRVRATTDGSSGELVWKDSKSKDPLFSILSESHSAELGGSKSAFRISRNVVHFPKGKSVSWGINISPLIMTKGAQKDDEDGRKISISFSASKSGTFMVDTIFIGSPGRAKKDGVRIEPATLSIGFTSKACQLKCDDWNFCLDKNTVQLFRGGMDSLLKAKTISVQYKNAKGRLTKIVYDLKEFKLAFEAMAKEAKEKYNEVIEFKFSSKAK